MLNPTITLTQNIGDKVKFKSYPLPTIYDGDGNKTGYYPYDYIPMVFSEILVARCVIDKEQKSSLVFYPWNQIPYDSAKITIHDEYVKRIYKLNNGYIHPMLLEALPIDLNRCTLDFFECIRPDNGIVRIDIHYQYHGTKRVTIFEHKDGRKCKSTFTYPKLPDTERRELAYFIKNLNIAQSQKFKFTPKARQTRILSNLNRFMQTILSLEADFFIQDKSKNKVLYYKLANPIQNNIEFFDISEAPELY